MKSKEELLIAHSDDIDAVCQSFGVDRSDLMGNSRKREIVKARIDLARTLRFRHELSFPAIALIMGRKNHTSIMHYCDALKDSAKVQWRQNA